jgi:hypothetical protein
MLSKIIVMETNIRFIQPGDALFLKARKVTLSKTDLSIDQLHTICTILKNRKIAATPYFENGKAFLLTEYRDLLRSQVIDLESADNTGAQIAIAIESIDELITLELHEPRQRRMIEELYLKRAQINILNNTGFKVISKSPNVYYDTQVLTDDEDPENDIVAYRRFYVFSEYFEGRGLGFGVDVGNSYFTKHSVEWYFANSLQSRFHELRERQSTEYKGTLLYKGPNGNIRCYFDRYDGNKTLQNTDSFVIKGRKFANSYEYFREVYPMFQVKPTDKVAYVSFKGMGTKPVPAKCLYLSISTENQNDDDKYTAQQKRNLIDGFWKKVGHPFGKNYLALKPEYYTPSPDDGGIFDMPEITFSNGFVLRPPAYKNGYIYKKYFLNKYHALKENGCFYVPPMMERNIHFAFPKDLDSRTRNKLMEDLLKDTSQLTDKAIDPTDHVYEKGQQLTTIYDLKNNYEKGVVVFVFDNNDPAVYYTISQELKGWKIIKMTKQELVRKFHKLTTHNKGKSIWENYVSLNAFKIVTELGCIPYIFKEQLHYPAQLVIDVSENYTHFGLGLLIWTSGMSKPLFDYVIRPNPDSRNDLINPLLLEKYLTELLSKHASEFQKLGITDLLVLRDGIENRSEYDVFVNVIGKLKSKPGGLPGDFDFTFIEYHKKSQKSLRFFESERGEVKNPFEGSWLKINDATAVLMNTGMGTLTQGTSSPVLIRSNYKKVDLTHVLRDIFLTSQLTFSSPRVAQKQTYLAKRIDDLLRERRAQEVIKIK